MATIKVACVLAEGFEDSEFRVPYERMKQAGFEVEVIASSRQALEGKGHRETVTPDRTIDEVKAQDYQALFIPGGYSPDHLRADERFVKLTREFDERKAPIFAICHGPQLLLAAGLVKGRTLTAWKTVQKDLQSSGATVKDEPVVRDGNWLTSRQPSDLEQFSEAAVKMLR